MWLVKYIKYWKQKLWSAKIITSISTRPTHINGWISEKAQWTVTPQVCINTDGQSSLLWASTRNLTQCICQISGCRELWLRAYETGYFSNANKYSAYLFVSTRNSEYLVWMSLLTLSVHHYSWPYLLFLIFLKTLVSAKMTYSNGYYKWLIRQHVNSLEDLISYGAIVHECICKY